MEDRGILNYLNETEFENEESIIGYIYTDILVKKLT